MVADRALEPLLSRVSEAIDARTSGQGPARAAAVDEVLTELASRLTGSRGGGRVDLGDEIVALARRQCREDVRMLGPLHGALCERSARHEAGQFFTPAAIAAQMAALVDHHRPETVLDPAVGAGVLLAACATPARRLGLDSSPLCAALTTAGLAARGCTNAEVRVGDFLADGGDDLEEPVDAVIANPPYQRHHLLDTGIKRALAQRYTARFDRRVTTLSSSYVYFLLEAVQRVRDGGVVVFITPADYLDARFGESIKHILRDRVTLDEVLLFDRSELAFDDVLTTSAITVLRRRPPPRHHRIRFTEAGGTNEVEGDSLDPASNWSLQFGRRRAQYEALTRGRPRKLSDHLRIRRGIATGANGFFLVDRATREEWDLPGAFLSRVIASARDLPDGVLRVEDWQRLRDSGRPCWLLDCDVPKDQIEHQGLRAYLEEGERRGVHRRFNCRSRTPWYRVERVGPPEIIVTYMQRGRTRFVRNDARCRLMSVFLNGFLLDGGVDELLEMLNSDETAKVIRAVSRTYGGGLVKIEPRALASLAVPVLRGG